METYWAIKRRDNERPLVHTCSWSRDGAWKRFEGYWRNTTRRRLRKEFVAVKVNVTIVKASA